ncbi:hypothetical protein BKH46_00865 [Helicobacter sp. 12S02634-8]|nr:hypothetical protein BKH46_00865 [Helicobacter sp. 12S02634-8]
MLDIVRDGEEYLLVDCNSRIYRFSLKDFMFSFSKSVGQNDPIHHHYSKAITCSLDSYILIPRIKKSISNIYKLSNNHLFLTTRLKWHRTDVSVAKFSQDCKYLATGGEDGRVFIYTHPNHRYTTFLPRRADYISALAFSEHSKQICYASYDMSFVVYDLERDTEIWSAKSPSVIEDMVFFDGDTKIFYVCKDGEVGVFDIQQNSNTIKAHLLAWPTKIVLSGAHIYIGTRENMLYIYHLPSHTLNHPIELASKGVGCLKIYENLLFICFVNGNIQIIDKLYQMDAFLALLDQNNFKQAKAFAEEHNILLKTLDVYTKVKNTTWPEALKSAIKSLVKSQSQGIPDIALPYLEDLQKAEEIKKYIAERSSIAKFLSAFESRDYYLACKIANDHPCIKDLQEYEKINEYFEKICNISNYLVFSDPNTGKEKFSILAEPFKDIPDKKPIVTTILGNWEQYLIIERYAKKRDFANYFNALKPYPFLKKSRTYQKMFLICENIAHQTQSAIANKDYPQAQEYLKLLAGVEPFVEFVSKSQNYINNIELFLSQYQSKNYTECYKILDKYPEIRTSEEAITLYKETSQVFAEAKSIAQKGDVGKTYQKIQNFLSIAFWKNKVDITMKIAYLYEMFEAFESGVEGVDWSKSIGEYVLRYGRDDEIKNFCNPEPELQKILENISVQPSNEQSLANIKHIQSIIFKKN